MDGEETIIAILVLLTFCIFLFSAVGFLKLDRIERTQSEIMQKLNEVK
jgi:hypothetical protein